MTPLQELTDANLTATQYIHFTGWLAFNLDVYGVIDRQVWTETLTKAKGHQQ
ncbi:hypothetical protein [Arthrobacter castelli]|uniref:hypothetical protein n=1 Tax=Arthrobacter castelli TaxID=271431 RepID=UPI000412A9D9|nr:hypothetical protein [Arthrobacter castelli]